MKILGLIGVILICIAAIATPISIGWGLYQWATDALIFKMAAWEGFKIWISMVACVIPGIFLITFYKESKKGGWL